MKLALTITDASPSELSSLLAALSASGASVAVAGQTAPAPMPAPAPQPSPAPADDDDNAPVNTNAPMLDKDGLPWDERIHAKTKATNADGTWRRRRGVEDAFVKEIETLLRQPAGGAQFTPPPPMFDGPAPSTPPQPAPMPSPMSEQPQVTQAFTPPPMPMAAPQPAPMPSPGPAPQPSPAPVAQPEAQPAPAPADFGQFMQGLQNAMNTKKDANGLPMVTHQVLTEITNQIATAYGIQLSAITDLAAHPDKIAYAVQLFQHRNLW